jgi:hypothetical protein
MRRLGAGGFGIVWEAHDERLDRVVALKQIYLPAEIDRERATREARANARLKHPAIVALYEAHAEDEEFYLVSELVRGQTLAQLITRHLLSDEDILRIGAALADALEHAHQQGVIHRDVKPQNVLIPDAPAGPGEVAKLADFGGAHLTDSEALTRTGDVLGTLAYMAPEQCDGLATDHNTDLYSLALVLYEALTGTNPVRGETQAETARRIGMAIPPLERNRRDLPRQLTNAIDRALTRNPKRRGTLADLRDEALRQLHRPTRRGRAERLAPPDRVLHPGYDTPLLIEDEEDAPGGRRRWYQLPRGVWWTLVVGIVGWQAIEGHFGMALVLCAAAFPLLALPRRSSPAWALGALAGALGWAGLAGAFPAVSGALRDWRARAGLGALGYWWLVLAEPLLDQRLWLGSPPGTPPLSAWEPSLTSAADHVVYPLLSLAVLLGAALWAAGSIVLPWIVRGHSLAADMVFAGLWAGALAATESLLDHGLPGSGAGADPRGLVASAVVLALAAIAVRALRGPD